MRITAITIFTAWFVLSALAQIRIDRLQAIRRWDLLGLLPGWNFFAPDPIRTDLLLYYRLVSDETVGPWVKHPVPRPRRLLDALLHPLRRERKALFEACASLIAATRAGNSPAAIMLSAPYLLLLGVAETATIHADASAVQFAIGARPATLGAWAEREVFRSEVHRHTSRSAP